MKVERLWGESLANEHEAERLSDPELRSKASDYLPNVYWMVHWVPFGENVDDFIISKSVSTWM